MNVHNISPYCPLALSEAVRDARCFSDIFETIRPLSCFGSCFVSLCLDKTTQQNVVVKTYLKHKLGTAMLLQVQTEMQIHHSLNHPSIVKMLLSFEDCRNIYLVVAFAENGDLRREGNLVGMTEDRARDFLVVPVLQALSLLHKEGIVHRDLKPENCLVDKDNCLLLADFGLSMYSGVGREGESGTPSDDDAGPPTSDGTSESPDKSYSIASAALLEERAAACAILASVAAGTPLYTAPEVLFCMFQNQPMNEAVQPKNDVWALGVMLLEVLTGIHPFSPDACASGQSNNVMYNIAHTKSVSLPAFLSPMIADFLSLALKRDPDLRPSAAELLQHPWITSPVRQVQKVRPGSMSSLRLPSTCGTPSSRSSDHCGQEDDEEEEPPILSCARISQMQSVVSPGSGPVSHRRIVTVAFEGQDCWED